MDFPAKSIHYYSVTGIWPAKLILIEPAQEHINLLSLLRAGILPINTVGAPATQGATVIGIQGMGVRIPNAAAVAAITVGFAMLLHTPNGKILSNGILSIILAAGISTITGLTGNTTSVEGAAPKVHERTAPEVTKSGISTPNNL
jgi:hypothetical protein